jgi:hypothetical protein
MTYGNVNVDTVTTSTPNGILGAGNASIMKNRIINGSMTIDQRNAGASVTPTNATYTLDRWRSLLTQAGKYTVQQNAGSVTPPDGFRNYLGVTSSSAYSVISSDYFVQQQFIEGFNTADLGFGTANAKAINVSFWVRSSLTGTFGGSVFNNDGSRCYAFTYTISSANTWEQKTVNIAGDTTGTWNTTNLCGLGINFGLGVGSANAISAGSWSGTFGYSATGATSVVGTNGATFYITGVQLEVGSSATGFEYRQYQQELALCQRYYTKLTAGGAYTAFGTAACTSTTAGNVCITWPVNMRATPTISWSNCGINNPSQIALTSSFAPNSYYAGSNSGFCSFTVASGLTANGAAMFNANNNTSAYVDVTAEL